MVITKDNINQITNITRNSSGLRAVGSGDENLESNESRIDFYKLDALSPEPRALNLNENIVEKPRMTWDKARSIAEWVCSRESVFRMALDLTGWEIPTVIAGATRNIYSFAESSFQAVLGWAMMVLAPTFTKGVGHLFAKFFLKPEEQNEVSNYLLFQLNDLDDDRTMQQGVSRMAQEEPEDCSFLADINKHKPGKVAHYQDRAKSIVDFFNKFEINDDIRTRLKKLKKAVILGESFIEGTVWGSFFVLNRLFRKYVLKQDRFTGTKAYESDEESKKLGDSGDMKWWQKLGVASAMLSGPAVNSFLLNKFEDKEAVAKSPWLQMFKRQIDMTHGVFPKLGLMFNYLFLPWTMGSLFASQGVNELIENLLMTFVMSPSWWFGHRATNGVLAKGADKKLSEKFGIDRGILVEPGDLHKPMPEPAKIQHILKQVKHDPKLMLEARDQHAKVLYKGFALHSLLVFAAKMFINWVTKWRVGKKLNAAK